MNIQQFLEEEAKKHLAHVGGDERTIPALVMLLKDVSNKVLDELQILVLKHPNTYEGEEELVFRTTLKEISTIINQLKLKDIN